MTNTNKEKKITKRERFNRLLAMAEVQADSEMVEFIKHEIELLDRKNSGNRKPTANQIENEKIKSAILAEMRANPDRLYKATELGKIIEPIVNIYPLVNQRITAILRKMLVDGGTGEVKRVEDKRNAYFQIVTD